MKLTFEQRRKVKNQIADLQVGDQIPYLNRPYKITRIYDDGWYEIEQVENSKSFAVIDEDILFDLFAEELIDNYYSNEKIK